MTPTSSPQPMPGLRERKKARTRATIQREALRLFSRDGYTETSVEQIAAAAEISPSTFFRYFATKEDVVLADFIDSGVVARTLSAPAELSALGALRYALESMGAEMGREDLELEQLRNRLIRSVPELRRGMVAELTRPVGLLAEAIAARLGRASDDADVWLWAGAVIGALVLGGEPGRAEDAADGSPGAMVDSLTERCDRLEQIVVLPGE